MDKSQSSDRLDFCLLLKQAVCSVNKHKKCPITLLKPKQVECLRACVAEGRDTLGILPTGYGKSLVFELLPVFAALFRGHKGHSKCIIISPLNAIIQQQKNVLGEQAQFVAQEKHKQVTEEDEEESTSNDDDDGHGEDEETKGVQTNIHEGNFSFLLGHPEEFTSKKVMQVLKDAKWNHEIHFIVIDEVHCVVHWGETFRPQFRELDQLRSLFPRAVMMGLTATATMKSRKEIQRFLCMENTVTITTKSERTNLKYVVKERPAFSGGGRTVEDSYTSVFCPLIEELKANRMEFPKTMLFTGLNWCGFGNELGVKLLAGGQMESIGIREIRQYHAPMSAEMKEQVVKALTDEDGARLLFATEAFGMGVDIKDIRRIIHVGTPSTLETYVQEIGRGGRDGLPCECILHFNKSDIGRKNVTEDMRDFCTSDECRRQFLNKAFGNDTGATDHHSCCDNCQRTCSCEECSRTRELAADLSDDPFEETPAHDRTMEEKLQFALLQYFNAVNEQTDQPGLIDPALLTGLTPALAGDIAHHYEQLVAYDTFCINYKHIDSSYLHNIHDLMTVVITSQAL